MQSINVTLEIISIVSPIVAKIVIDGEHAGYICENRGDNKEAKPHSLVSLEGKDIGDFCCTSHAVREMAKRHCGDDGIYIDASNPVAQFGALGVLLAALLESQAEKSPHEAG